MSCSHLGVNSERVIFSVAVSRKYGIMLVINNILSYIQCARQTDTAAEVTQSAAYFYEYEEICKAKAAINQEIGEKVVQRRQPTVRGKCIAELEDILNAFCIAEQKGISLPTYTAHGLNALPPANGYQFFKNALDVMMDEIKTLRNEVESLKSQREGEDSGMVLKTLNDMKTSLKADIQAIRTPELSHPSDIPPMGSSKRVRDVLPENRQTDVWPLTDISHINNWPWLREPGLPGESNYSNNMKTSNGKSYSAVAKKPAAPKTRLNQAKDQNVDTANDPAKKTVQPKQKQASTKKRPDVIRGNREPVGKFVGADRQADLYVGGCKKQVIKDDIHEYCKNVLKVDLIECIDLKTKSTRFSSFKLSLNKVDRDNLLVSDLWPVGTVVRKFTNPRGVSANAFSSKNTDVGNVDQEKFHDAQY